ncbi:elongation factor P [Cucumis melo var. makuwa]|uniref:Elongation factor P n=1 Tax=Cucumis melo var. makuwa TaxID=1194695 RepID=A0A5A7TQ46_CUCMM|nr:elongation factor P [Cucumis melo var. makuwa]TYK24908.1 elongation factor P [Cucumis melo var. makuwa]
MAGTLLCNASLVSAFLARTSSSKTSLSLPLKSPVFRTSRSSSPSSRTGFFSKPFRIYALTSNDIKVGTNLEVDGAPWRVLEFLHVKPGKGAAFVRTKIRNYVTGNTVEKTFRAGSSLEEANVYKEVKQFTYKDGSQFVFMDLNTYEEIRLNAADVGDRTKWLKEGMDCVVLFWNGKVIDFEVPITIQLTVVDVDPGLKGDTAQGDKD